MSAYRTCFNCARAKAPCSRRERIAAGVKGLGLTSIKFRCPEREPVFAIGQRVSVTWPVPFEEECYEESWPATVVAESGPRFLIIVDDVDSDEGTPARDYIKSESLYARVSTSKLRPLDEPKREVCGVCQAPREEDGSFSRCYAYDKEFGGGYSYTPRGCLKAALASCDTHPQGGNSPQSEVPFMGSAVPSAETADAPPHSGSQS